MDWILVAFIAIITILFVYFLFYILRRAMTNYKEMIDSNNKVAGSNMRLVEAINHLADVISKK